MNSRAAILRNVGGPWSVEPFELDAPRAGEVLLRMAAAGLCHSDTHILNGYVTAPPEPGQPAPRRPPTIGGHECSAVVMAVGDGVVEFAPGDHVVTSFVPACANAVGAQQAWNTSAISARAR